MFSWWLIPWKIWFIGFKTFAFVDWFIKDILLCSHIWFHVRIVSLQSLENLISFTSNLFNCPFHPFKADSWIIAHSCWEQLDAKMPYRRIPNYFTDNVNNLWALSAAWTDDSLMVSAGLPGVQYNMGVGTWTERIQGDADRMQGSHT